MLVLVGPSASGKSEIVKELVKNYHMQKFVTTTTRPMRTGEANGVDYYFISVEEFLTRLEAHEFIETVAYNGNYYGTYKKEILENKVVILEPSGLMEFRQYTKDIFAVFLKTDEKTLEQRMQMRGDDPIDIQNRLANDKLVFASDILIYMDLIVDTTNRTKPELAALIYEAYQKSSE